MAAAEPMASFPVRSTQALPLFTARAAASDVTLGRLSKIMATTPMGTDTRRMESPLGRVISRRTLPTGSGSFTTSRMPSAMAWMRASVSMSLSSITGVMCDFAASISLAFAARMASVWASSCSAMESRARFFSSADARARDGAAAFASLSCS